MYGILNLTEPTPILMTQTQTETKIQIQIPDRKHRNKKGDNTSQVPGNTNNHP